MMVYKNISEESGVIAYELLAEGIRIQFITKDVYYYSYSAPGKEHVEKMKELAEKGRGLATYISQKIRKNFDHKEEKS
jgi:hypothetical protein